MTTVLLNAFFEFGNKLGYYSAAFLTIFGLCIWVVVMFKYLNSSDLK